jgi:dihydroorotase
MASKKYDLAIVGGRVIDPALGFYMDASVLIKDSRIAGVETETAVLRRTLKSLDESRIIDASGKLITPGLIDVHVHLREPGQEGA